jgi:hypothetical protein
MVHVQNWEPKKKHSLLSTHETKEQNNFQTHIHPNTSMSTCNFDVFLILQCANVYHIFHYNLVIFMQMYKWSFMQKSKHDIHFVPKFKSRWTMEFFQPQQPLIFLDATFCLGFFKFTKTTTSPILNYNPPNNSQH